MTEIERDLGRKGTLSPWHKSAREFAIQVSQERRKRQMTAWALAEQCQLSVRIVEDLERGFPVEQCAIVVVCRNLDLPVPSIDGDPVHTLALLVRQRREQARLKQYQLAALAGIAAKTLKEIERGCHWPNPETCVGLLSVTALQLMPQEIAVFVPDPAAATDRAQNLRASAEVRINACQEMLTRAKAMRTDQPCEGHKEPPTRLKPRLLFTFRVYRDGSMTFVPSGEPRRK